MKNRIVRFIETSAVFVFLLPIFFVLHGVKENFGFVPLPDAALLTGTYLLTSAILLGLSWLIFRNLAKAALVTFFIMSFHFFFGGVHDSLKKMFPGTFVSRYSFILSASFIALVLLSVIVKRMSDRPIRKLTTYLNSLLLLITVFDGCLLLGKCVFRVKPAPVLGKELTKCDRCPKPDVYFILTDEYAGYEELKNIFHYDNSAFEGQLAKKGFHIVNHSYSNYNYTPFSVASILNMDYLQLKDTSRTGTDLAYAYQEVKDSRVIKFFQAHGYKFYNYSVFEFEHQPAPVNEALLPLRTRLITAQTFLSRVQRDLWFHTITFFKSRKSIRDLRYFNNVNNKRIYQLTWDAAGQRGSQSKFVYAHLMMPHYPYYYDKNGNELPFERLVEGAQVNQDDYIGYLQYTNRKILDLVDHIQKSSAAPPIIIVMGDHGFRHFRQPVERKYHFMNLSAVYFPDRNYSALADSTSSVNFFRCILNGQFGQHLAFLKDSSIYLRD